ncbi:MAG: TonB-dependent receptor [Bacteroidota bacterium]|nr:TonB-dependent receptor [Bacteroidota bacterium]MDP4250931.1 TonB-dependent receptor [Bacteroidota bacterium]
MRENLHCQGFLRVILMSLILISAGQTVFGRDADEAGGTVKGRVATTDNMPAAGVTITIHSINRNTITNEEGDFVFHHIRAGNYEVEISVIGYETVRQSLVVENGLTTNLSVQIRISAKELQAVVVNSSRTPNEKKLALGKADIAAMDLPQAVTVLDKELIDRQQVLTLGDALMNVNGVYVMGYTGGTQQEIGARGYPFNNTNTFKNGVLYNNGVMPEMSAAERVEFLKGSAAILLGNVTAGGVLNIVTKKPLFEKGGEIGMRMGSYDFYKPTLDFYGPLGDSKSVAYRVNATYEKERSFRNDVKAERFYINPSFLIAIDKKTTVLLEGDYLADRRTPDIGVGAINFKINDIPRNRFLGAAWSYNQAQESSVTVTTTHQFNADWQLRNITGFYNYTADMFGTTRPGDQGGVDMQSNGNWVRGVVRNGSNEDFYQTQLDLTGKFKTGSLKHQLLFGAVVYKDMPHTLTYNPLVVYDSINVFDLGKYPQRADIPGLSLNTLTRAPVNVLGIYAQDLLSITDKLKLLAGVRFNSQQTVSNIYNYSTQAEAVTKIHAHPFTPRFGIVYQPMTTFSLFASYSNSFNLNTGVDTSGKALPPSFINQYEAGFKSDWFDHLLSFNVTAYQIVNSNLAQTSLANGNTNSNIKELEGEVTSKGVEVDIASRPINGFTVMAGYSYNNTRYTKSNTYKDGSPLQYAPVNTANASVYYAFHTDNVLNGFSLGLIGFYVDGMQAGKETRLRVQNDNRRLIPLPDFTQVDASLGYHFKKADLRVKLSNLFDVPGYYAHEDESINPIAPREFSATLSCKL